MKTLRFNVNDQVITKDPMCDFSGLVKGSGSIKATFKLSKEWNGHKIAVSFFKLGEEFPALLKNGVCVIPEKALTWNEFHVQVVGLKNGNIIKTNKLSIKQEG